MANSKREKVTGVVTVISKNDEVRKRLINVEGKLASIQKIRDTPFKVSASNSTIQGIGNIREERLVENLIRALSVIRTKKREYDDAATDANDPDAKNPSFGFGLKVFPEFKFQQATIAEWHHDLLLQKSIVEQEETIKKLTAYKDKWSKFITEDDQKAMLIEEMDNDPIFAED